MVRRRRQRAAFLHYHLSMPRPPELDLHGHTVDQALARFATTYNAACAAGRSKRLVVIHGWNESAFKGSIADTLHRMLHRRGIRFDHPIEGNPGRTSVRIGAAMPQPAGHVSSAPKQRRTKGQPPRKLSGGL